MCTIAIIKRIYIILLYFLHNCLNIILSIKNNIFQENEIQPIYYYPTEKKPSGYKSINSSSLQITNYKVNNQ